MMPRRPENPVVVCQRWNQAHPVGSRVEVRRDNGQRLATKTRSEAFVEANGLPVIFVERINGYYKLDRVTAVEAKESAT
jgi:hypothetical protein